MSNSRTVDLFPRVVANRPFSTRRYLCCAMRSDGREGRHTLVSMIVYNYVQHPDRSAKRGKAPETRR